jgi:hypothetical protein
MSTETLEHATGQDAAPKPSPLERIHEDIMHLAGRLIHRGAQTEQERLAADYLQGRLRTYTPDVDRDPFASFDNHRYLFASFYGEFAIVCLAAIWFPAGAAVYGILAFTAYLAEFMGFSIVSRLLPRYESQNVVGRFLGLRPKGLIIIHAHYDSGCASPMTRSRVRRYLRHLHYLMVFCMAVIIATCVASAAGEVQGMAMPLALYVRWGAFAVLLSGALALFLDSSSGEEIRGANVNASGVAAALEIAERLAADPVENADVWVAFTGANEAWMSGMRVLLEHSHLDRDSTHILNLEGIGAGQLSYTRAEGMLHGTSTDPALRWAAESLAGNYDIRDAALRAVPSSAHLPLSHGYPTMSVVGLDEDGIPPHWNQITDRVTEIDDRQILQAAEFGEAIVRKLDADWSKAE